MMCREIFPYLHCASDLMMLYNYLHRGKQVSESSLVCKNIEKPEVSYEGLLQILKQVQSSQERNTEGDYGLYNLVYSLLKLESME